MDTNAHTHSSAAASSDALRRKNWLFASPWWPWILVAVAFGLAAVLRFVELGARPMHADEAVQAYIFADLLEHGDYRYDPAHYHGPLPHFINWPLTRVLGVQKLDVLQAWQFRLLPALAGMALVAFAALSMRANREMVWRAAVLAAVSPLLVYFSRMAIHEVLLACCALAVPLTVQQWLATRRIAWLIALGVALGFLHATKETWSIIAFSWVAAVVVMCPKKTVRAIRETGAWRITLAVLVALGVSFLLYSDFGRHPGGFWDAWRTQFAYRTGGGHEKAWYYYFVEVLSFYPAGWVWGKGVITVFTLIGGFFAWRARGGVEATTMRAPWLAQFLALSAVVQIVVYSIIKYKTPWLMLVPVASLVPLAAYGWARVAAAGGQRSFASAACVFFVLIGSYLPAWIGSNSQAENFAIPFVYAPTLREADAALRHAADELPPNGLVAVIGDDYWPLPWYFRAHREHTGYFSEQTAPSNAELEHFALVIRAGSQLDPVQQTPLCKKDSLKTVELRPGYYVRIEEIRDVKD